MRGFIRAWRLAVVCGVVMSAGTVLGAARVEVKPMEPAGLGVVVEGQTLKLQAVEVREGKVVGKTPANYEARFEDWDPWPSVHPAGTPANYVALSPKKDEDNVSILGGLFRAILPESVVVSGAEGKTFKMGEDYKFNERWGQVSAIDGRLGKAGEGELTVTYKYATQRLDLVQVDGAGKVSVKTGAARMVCPVLPEPDAGSRGVAGIYVAPWRREGKWVVMAEDIYPIEEVAPVMPVNAKALAKTKEKLAAGKDVKIAFMGDSISLGAEAGLWWNDMWTEKSTAFVSRFVVGLRKKYPTATVTPIAAFKGGITVHAAGPFMEKSVIPEKPDLVVIEFGLNDASGPVGKRPTNPPESFKADILALIKQAKAAGSEVLLVTPFEGSPFMKNGQGQRIPEYRKVLLELSKEQDVACADVYPEWMNQAKRGVPPFSQVHNWINHPDSRGHGLYAEVMLRFFE